ncbi:MAG: xanthan lyase [Alistipes sp.]|nr:xanthan lyase [Alistipes sp.]
MKRFPLILIIFILVPTLAVAQEYLQRSVRDSLTKAIQRITLAEVAGSYAKVESVRVSDSESPTVEVRVSKELAYFPMRGESLRRIYDAVGEKLPEKYRRHTLLIYSDGRLIDDLVPVMYSSRVAGGRFTNRAKVPLVRRLSRISEPTKGLANRHIALWQSHGRYFNNSTGEWGWQRSILWETVEDLYTQSYVIPYLLPMLESAGATVLLPRERSMRHEELIIDNDEGIDPTTYTEYNGSEPWEWGGLGFAHLHETYPTGHNPFHDGTTRRVATTDDKDNLSKVVWGGEIPVSGEYSLYVSYRTEKRSVTDAHYTVHASGGDREFLVNQRMGGSMWLCLGDFYFDAGTYEELVTLDNYSTEEGYVVADAVKIGGGMGNIRRDVHSDLKSEDYEYPSEVSGYPRFTEGARYWLQWSGFEEDVYAPKAGKDDYRDDYMSRPHWVNSLMRGSERYDVKQRKPKRGEVVSAGRNIPLDLTLAFHSDAGVRLNDDIIGTLGIYCTKDDGGEFEDDISRLRSRDLTDIVMSQIVADIRAKYEPNWVRRGMWDRAYYEARIPRCPTMLLELLSHQNFADMRYGLDPSFRFDVSRAVYKGVLRYLASQYATDYVVQPLAVRGFSARLTSSGAKLSWEPTPDPLEPTAKADYYILYTRVDGGGFDLGRRVDATSVEVEQDADKIYSYRITAVNEGGESFPSETLSACRLSASRGEVMVVNGFDRVAAPMSVQGDSIAGFYNRYDSGAAYLRDISFTGEQVNFQRSLSKEENDAYALGQSYSDYETEIVAGNSFDYPSLHGEAIVAAGYSFSSASRLAVESGSVELSEYEVVDLILGKQRTTTIGRGAFEPRFQAFGEAMKSALRDYTANGGNLVVSGSYALSDLWHSPLATDDDRTFANEILHASFGGDMATQRGVVRMPVTKFSATTSELEFTTELNSEIYCVESPEVVSPADKETQTILRYRSNNRSAATAYRGDYGVVLLGFPFETITSADSRKELMQKMLDYFANE